ncbi:MAG: hypothetical protein LRY32_01735 [Flavobacterium sp.]|nr:hypothetical protein [Flavobacterium sp.]
MEDLLADLEQAFK